MQALKDHRYFGSGRVPMLEGATLALFRRSVAVVPHEVARRAAVVALL
jgi:hypothetical protein